jgi:L-threonylcarbamoyladenylate synthase
METKIITIKAPQGKLTGEDIAEIKKAGEIIKNGGIVAFPTETVYGLGGDALNAGSSEKIYAAKGRPSDNPLIVHIARMEDLDHIVKKVPKAAVKLAEKYWPGPLTMIMEKADVVPYETTGGLDTVAVRFPADPVAQEFILAAGGYIAAPSANRSGRPSCTTAGHCIEDLDGRIDMIIDGGEVCIGLESTIVELTGDVPCLLRPGYISLESLRDTLGQVTADPAISAGADMAEGIHPKAPGMKYRHYAPKGELTLVRGNAADVIRKINSLTQELKKNGKKAAVISSTDNAGRYSCDNVMDIGSSEDEDEIAHRLFAVLRKLDDMEVEYIYSECFETPKLGQAIMNRLEKAAGHRIITV